MSRLRIKNIGKKMNKAIKELREAEYFFLSLEYKMTKGTIPTTKAKTCA